MVISFRGRRNERPGRAKTVPTHARGRERASERATTKSQCYLTEELAAVIEPSLHLR